MEDAVICAPRQTMDESVRVTQGSLWMLTERHAKVD